MTDAGRPVVMIECKLGDAPISRSLRYLHTRFPQAEAWQLSASGSKDYRSTEGIRVAPALAYLATLV